MHKRSDNSASHAAAKEEETPIICGKPYKLDGKGMTLYVNPMELSSGARTVQTYNNPGCTIQNRPYQRGRLVAM